MGVETVVVVAGGHPSPGAVPELPSGAYVIAADAGVDRGLALGLRIDRAIGDFDSVSAAGLAAAEAAGAIVERLPGRQGRDRSRARARRRDRARARADPRRRQRRRPARPPARLDPAARRRPLCGGDGRCISGRQPDRGDPRLAHADRHARRHRHAASRARPGRRSLDEWARVPAPWRDPPAGHDARCLERLRHGRSPRSRSGRAAWWPSNPAPSERSPCDTLAQAWWQR